VEVVGVQMGDEDGVDVDRSRCRPGTAASAQVSPTVL
jgi:hypothetical protein